MRINAQCVVVQTKMDDTQFTDATNTGSSAPVVGRSNSGKRFATDAEGQGIMTENFEYHDDRARSGARQFDEVGGQLGALASSLSAELAADSPWSQDKIGSSFASKFDSDRSQVIENLKSFAERVESFGPVLKSAADKVTSADDEGAK